MPPLGAAGAFLLAPLLPDVSSHAALLPAGQVSAAAPPPGKAGAAFGVQFGEASSTASILVPLGGAVKEFHVWDVLDSDACFDKVCNMSGISTYSVALVTDVGCVL